LKPGTYQVSATSLGLQSDTLGNIAVRVGQVISLDITVAPMESKQTVEVIEASLLIQVETANVADTFSSRQVNSLPAPVGDLTSVAFTAPGVTVNTNAGFGYGNFSSQGMPGISNLFTTNGMDVMDIYQGLNNMGPSNAALGLHEIQEATVLQNAYSPQ